MVTGALMIADGFLAGSVPITEAAAGLTVGTGTVVSRTGSETACSATAGLDVNCQPTWQAERGTLGGLQINEL